MSLHYQDYRKTYMIAAKLLPKAGRKRFLPLKQVEASLRESETKFQTLTNTTTAAIFVCQGTRLCYVNPATQAITGHSQAELLAMNFWDVIHPDSREDVKGRGLARQRGEAVPGQYEVKLLTKNNETRWIDMIVKIIEFEGKPAILGTALDITRRKQAEEALRWSEAKLKSYSQ